MKSDFPVHPGFLTQIRIEGILCISSFQNQMEPCGRPVRNGCRAKVSLKRQKERYRYE